MATIGSHLRKTFLAGFIAGIPIGITLIIALWIDSTTRPLARKITGLDIPFSGIVVVLISIWLLGVIVSSFFGRMLVRRMDHMLTRVPILRPLYEGWKQVLVLPGHGTQSIFSHVVLVSDPVGWMLGFTNAKPLEADPGSMCVFIPAAPNPISGRLYFVSRDRCKFVKMTTEEAFKLILSTGNYVPDVVGAAMTRESML